MDKRGLSRRQRGELTLAALAPAALGLLRPVAAAGRLGWLGPLLALPVGLLVCRLWREVDCLPAGLERAFGKWGGRGAELLYLLWGLVLLWYSAGEYLRRAEAVLPQGESRWFILGCGAAVSLWLGRGREEIFGRTGRLFFPAAAVALGFALVLAAPGLDWQNLWPPERGDGLGILTGAALSLSLTGYGVFTLCLPCREGEDRGKLHAVWGAAALAWSALTVTGTFGPALAAELGEPFLAVLQGVEVPGAFRRGEAALWAVAVLTDFVLLTLLGRGCRSLWEGLTPPGWRWAGHALPVGAILAAGALPGQGALRWITAGGVALGTVVPALAAGLGRARRGAYI